MPVRVTVRQGGFTIHKNYNCVIVWITELDTRANLGMAFIIFRVIIDLFICRHNNRSAQ
jgi:hypothetical protein